MFNPFDTNAHVWRPIFNPFNFLHDVYASEDVDFGSSYDLIGKNKNHPALEYGYVYFSDGSESNRFNYYNSHTKHITIQPYMQSGQVFRLKPKAGYTVNLKNSDTGQSYAVTPSNPFELPLNVGDYHKLEFLSITKESSEPEPEETEPESDETEETAPDQTDDGSTLTTQSFSFKPVDTTETEKSNIGFYVGVVAALAASVWYFTSQ
jgi:hypothetical protein|tara:strand:+ start:311 stop:931 length:621 start_codon:yes stop_codon:yes gene_type:complete